MVAFQQGKLYENGLNLFEALGYNTSRTLSLDDPTYRKALDNIIFDELGLTQEERNEVYWSVAELVKQRLDKAASR